MAVQLAAKKAEHSVVSSAGRTADPRAGNLADWRGRRLVVWMAESRAALSVGHSVGQTACWTVENWAIGWAASSAYWSAVCWAVKRVIHLAGRREHWSVDWLAGSKGIPLVVHWAVQLDWRCNKTFEFDCWRSPPDKNCRLSRSKCQRHRGVESMLQRLLRYFHQRYLSQPL